VLSGAKVVIDHTTGLMWQQDGSKDYMTREDADQYIGSLNRQGFTPSSLPSETIRRCSSRRPGFLRMTGFRAAIRTAEVRNVY